MAVDVLMERPRAGRMWAALVWEQWRLSRAALLLALPVMVGYVVQALWLGDWVNRYLFVDTSGAFGTPCFLWAPAIMALLFMHVYPGVKDIRLEFARRYFVLPLATPQVMLVQLTYRLTVACVLALPVAYLSWRQPDIYLSDLGPLSAFVVLVGLVLSGQALAVFVTAYGVLGGCVMGAVFVIFLLGEAVLLVLAADPAGTSTTPLYAFCAVYAAFCTVVPWVILGRIRHGESVAPVAAASSRRSARSAVNSTRPFASKLTAQVWFEWMRSIRYFAWVGIGAGVVAIVLSDWGNGVPLAAWYTLVMATALISGYLLIRTSTSYLTFVGVKPMSDAQLGLAKLASAFLGLMVAVATGAIALAWVLTVVNPRRLEFMPNTTQTAEVMVVVGLWVAALWLALAAGRVGLALLAIWGVVMGPFALLMQVTISRPALNALVATFAIVVVACGLACLTAWGLHGRVPWRRALAAVLAAFPILYACMCAGYGLYGSRMSYVARVVEERPWLGAHFNAIPFFLIAAGLLVFAAIVAERVTWRRALAGVAIAYVAAIAQVPMLIGQPWLHNLLAFEVWLVCPLGILALVSYMAWKRGLVSASWVLFTVMPCAAAMLTVFAVVLPSIDAPDDGLVALLVLMPVCAVSLFWPPLAVRLQRHR